MRAGEMSGKNTEIGTRQARCRPFRSIKNDFAVLGDAIKNFPGARAHLVIESGMKSSLIRCATMKGQATRPWPYRSRAYSATPPPGQEHRGDRVEQEFQKLGSM